MRILRSSHIQEAELDADRLRVRFRNGETYEWTGIAAKEYAALVQAPSPGSFLHSHIRKFHGSGRKIENATRIQ